jgi:hypothetical protein
MPVFTGIGLAVGALETAAASIGAAAASSAAAAGIGTTAAAAGTAGAAGALGSAGAGFGATLGAGSIAGGVGAGLAGTAAAGTTAAATAGTGAGLLSVGNIATGAGILGTGIQGASTVGQMIAGQDAVRAQQQQEALRQKQMQLEAERQRREIIRQTQISQAIGINNAANSGAAIDSSVLSGITGQNATNAGYQIGAVNQNEAIGNALFTSNMQESNANATASLFKGAGQFGSVLANNNMQIGRLGSTLFNG